MATPGIKDYASNGPTGQVTKGSKGWLIMPVYSGDRKTLIEHFGQEQASLLNPALSLDVESNQGTTLRLDL